MDFYELYNNLNLTEQSVLSKIDEYTLYCYYCNIPNLRPGKTYPAPYRTDNVPSFSIYWSRSYDLDYMWYDHASGESGSIFALIGKIEGLAERGQVLAKINEDFSLGYNTDVVVPIREKIRLFNPPEKSEIKIEVTNKPFSELGLKFWQQFDISESLLREYKTKQVEYYWTYVGQTAPNQAPDPMFSYEVGGYYQLYSPYVKKEDKFRNNLPPNYFFGYLQLPKNGNILLLDKSCKDVIFCRRLDYWAVCSRSETTFLPPQKMVELRERFSKVYLMLDSDKAGRAMTDKYLALYPWLIPKFLPEELAKDKTDTAKKIGVIETKKLINSICG